MSSNCKKNFNLKINEFKIYGKTCIEFEINCYFYLETMRHEMTDTDWLNSLINRYNKYIFIYNFPRSIRESKPAPCMVSPYRDESQVE